MRKTVALIVAAAMGCALGAAGTAAAQDTNWSGYSAADTERVSLTTLERRALDRREAEKLDTLEEPAIRPYKSFLRGLAALGYHVGTSLKEGNEKLPFFGTVEVFVGLRRGAVELATSSYKGMMFSEAKPVTEESVPNAIIEDDPVLEAAANTAARLTIPPAAPYTTALQIATDNSPVDEEREERKAEKERRRAQKRYVGHRIDFDDDEDDRGNLLKKYG